MGGDRAALPRNQPGARRVDDRRVISGIIHVIRTGCPWRQRPPDCGPLTTICNRFNRRSGKRHWKRIFGVLAAGSWIPATVSMDASYVKAHRSEHAEKGGAKAQASGRSRGGRTTEIHAMTNVLSRPVALELSPGDAADIRMAEALPARCRAVKRLIADRGYDPDALRRTLRDLGTIRIVLGRKNRKTPVRHDRRRCRDRWRVEAAFCRLKDFRRIATLYDKLAANFLSAVCLVAVAAFRR